MGSRLAAVAADQIAHTLSLFFGPDDVFEVRALDHGGPGKKSAGWFLGSQARRAAAKVAQAAADAGGVYFTPNPSSRDCYRRCAGMLRPAFFPLTAAKDVPTRRFLLIDVDPVRPAAFKKDSATDAEKAAVESVAWQVRRFLAARRWLAPLMVDSGNGVHLYYRLPEQQPGGEVADSTTDPIACLLACLKARFDTPAAEIDPTVFDSSRIMKVPGTPALKGPGTADRPHRMSYFVGAPEGWADTVMQVGAATIAELLAELDPDGTIRVRRRAEPSSAAKPDKAPTRADASILDGLPPLERRIERARKFLTSPRTPAAIQGSGGSRAAFVAALNVIHGFCLDEQTAFDLLKADYNPRCQPEWSDKELWHKVRTAAAKQSRKRPGWKFENGRMRPNRTPSALVPTRASDPASPTTAAAGVARLLGAVDADLLNEAPDDPRRLAKRYMQQHDHGGRPTLAYWRGQFHEWTGTRYETIPDDEFEAKLNQGVYDTLLHDHITAMKEFNEENQGGDDKGGGEDRPKMTKVTIPLVRNVAASLKSLCLKPGTVNAPGWLSPATGPMPQELVAAKNALIHLPTYGMDAADGLPVGMLPHTPSYFNFNALGFDVNPAARPVEWLRFLDTLWPDDPESIATLQEWFGYFLTPDTSRQKMMLLLGPTRAGKGTITRVLRALIGNANVVSPKLASFGETFGLSNLVGKTVAIMEDVRLSGRVDKAPIAEALLTISGEGEVTVERKFLEPLNVRLYIRFLLVSNEIPRLFDASGALAKRWSMLRLTRSFEGQEDYELGARLERELPGIFNWSVEGWRRLRHRGRFTVPASVAELMDEVKDSGSAIGQFVNERCVVDEKGRVGKDDLYKDWVRWCESEGKKPGEKSIFAKELRAFVPSPTAVVATTAPARTCGEGGRCQDDPHSSR